jgi:HAD superfamily hydrolase (TIGR01549 family)
MIGDNDLFIFDWDGTLSTSTLIVAASRLLTRRYDPEYIKRNEARYKSIVRNVRIDETRSRELAWLYDTYVRVFPPRLKEGAVDLLRHLRRKRKTIALFSDSKSYRLTAELRMLRVFDYFDFVLSASSIGRYKPDPTGILAIVDRFGKDKKRCVYLGDTASDTLAARFAGINACAIGGGLEPYQKLVSVRPDYIYRDLGGILAGAVRSR